MRQADTADSPEQVNVLRISLPKGRFDIPPRIIAVLHRLPAMLVAAWVLTLPLEFTKTYFPNQIIEVSRVVLILCLLAFSAQVMFERREIRLPVSGSALGLALFTLYAAVSAVAVGSTQGIKTAAAMVAYLLMMLTIFNWTRSSDDHRRVWSALAVSVVILALVGLVLHVTDSYIWNAPNAGVSRLNVTFHDPNIFARFLAFSMLSMILLAADLDVTVRRRALWVAAAFAAAVILPFTYSRAVWAFTLLVAFVVVAAARRRTRALALVAMVVAVFAIVAIIDPSVMSRAALLASNLQSPFSNRAFLDRAPWLIFLHALPLDSVRLYLIGSGLIMFVDHPILGIGFGAFSQSLMGPYAGLIPPGIDTTTSHTALITVLAETGVVGLAIVLLSGFDFVRSTVWTRIQSPTQRSFVLAAAIALLFIVIESQLSGRLFDEPYLWLFLGLAYSARAGFENDQPDGSESRSG